MEFQLKGKLKILSKQMEKKLNTQSITNLSLCSIIFVLNIKICEANFTHITEYFYILFHSIIWQGKFQSSSHKNSHTKSYRK